MIYASVFLGMYILTNRVEQKKLVEFNIPMFNAPGNHEMDDKDPVVDGKPFPGKD